MLVRNRRTKKVYEVIGKVKYVNKPDEDSGLLDVVTEDGRFLMVREEAVEGMTK